MTQGWNYKCDECGKPATHAARDVVKAENWRTRCYDFIAGPPKFGCDEHPVESLTHLSRPFAMSYLDRK